MRKFYLLVVVAFLAGCVSSNGVTRVDPKGWWSERSDTEKLIIGGGSSMIVTGLIIRNGQGNNQSQEQCISTRSLETGCPR